VVQLRGREKRVGDVRRRFEGGDRNASWAGSQRWMGGSLVFVYLMGRRV
jgi:hypothetical protein